MPSSPSIVPRRVAPPEAARAPGDGSSSSRRVLGALRRAGWRRARNGFASLPLVVRVEIFLLGLAGVVLLAIHSDFQYFAFDEAEPDATWVTLSSRVLFGLVLLAGAILAQSAPRIVQRAGDAAFLAATPVPPRDDATWRADGLTAAAIPPGLLAVGLLLPPLEFGEWGTVLAAVAAWLAWLWVAAQAASWMAPAAPEAAWGPGGAGGVLGRVAHFAVVPLLGLAYYATREAIAAALDPRRVLSMWVTAFAAVLLGIGLRAAIRRGSSRMALQQARLREHRWVVEWHRRRRRERRPRLVRSTRPGSAWVWWQKDLRLIARTPVLRLQWMSVVALKAVALWLALRDSERVPWAFAGLLLFLSDLVAAIAVLQMWAREQSGWIWTTPSPRRSQWWARVAPPAALSILASVALAAWAAYAAGPEVARPLALWTLVSGVSLVVASGNLGASSPPQTALGQNLFALGLLCALLVGAVYPVVGWAVLGLFAAYTLRALATDPRR